MQPASLVRLDSQALPLGAAGELPSRLKVLAWGSNPSSKGTWILNEVSVRELMPNQKRANFDKVALDFNHNTVPGSETYRGEPAAVAAYGTPNLVANDGLYIEGLEWTKEGREFVGGRHYIDLSPTILPNERGEVLFLHSAAACRQGAITGLSLLSASIPAIATLIQTLTTTPASMDYKPLLCTLLNLSATATDAEVKTAADSFAAKAKATPHKATLTKFLNLSADASDAEIETAATDFAKKQEGKNEAAGDLQTMAATMKTLAADFAALKLNAAKIEIDGIKAAAASEGKVIPTEILAGPVGGDPVQLRALAASLPVTVPLEQRTSETPVKMAATLVANSAEDAVRKQLGFTVEEWSKLGKAA